MMDMPVMYIVAGPNGSGKTTFARAAAEGLDCERINADEIAEELATRNGGVAEDYGLEAVRAADGRVRTAIRERRHFVAETVLSSDKFQTMIAEARMAGFNITTLFVYLREAVGNVERIKLRVALGGHHVPEEKVVSRHSRSLANLEWCSRLSHQTIVYENDRDGYPVLVASRNAAGWYHHAREPFADFRTLIAWLWSSESIAELRG